MTVPITVSASDLPLQCLCHWERERASQIDLTFNGEALAYILAHSESRACFVGKMDDTTNLQTGIPASIPLIALPLAPAIKALAWNDT